MKYKNQKTEELFSINKVITLLKFKSAVNLPCFYLEAQSRERDSTRFRNRIRSLDCAFIRNTANSLQI